MKKTSREDLKIFVEQAGTLMLMMVGVIILCGTTFIPGDGIFDAYKDQSQDYVRPF